MRIGKSALLSSIAVSVLVPASAFAQTAEEGVEAEEIIVTARRQNERLLDVPASVSVIEAESLAKTGADNAQGFAQLTPGVTIVTGTAEAGDTLRLHDYSNF